MTATHDPHVEALNRNPADDALIVNARIVTGDGTIPEGYVRLGRGKITAVGPMDTLPEPEAGAALPGAGGTIDARGSWLLPGFIDVHVHGGCGGDFMDADAEAMDRITRFHGAQGTTTMLATTMTGSREELSRVLSAVAAYRGKAMPFAKLAGVHLEGPFINPKMAGAQNPQYMVPPQGEWLREWTGAYPGLIRILTLAPELEGADELIEQLTAEGIVVACGHTDAGYDRIKAAAKKGLCHAVHTFNAMRGLHHREPGVVGAVLTEEGISAEIIADGHHVHPAGIRLLTLTKRQDNLLLITDAMAAAGLGDGNYELGGQDVIVQDGIARLRDGGSLAASTLTMIGAFRYMVEIVGLSVEETSRLASGNPARRIGLSGTTGSIAAGLQADLVLVSPELQLEQVWVDGKRLTP